MNNLNTFPIEIFLEKARIALKTNQKSLNLDIKDVETLYHCLAVTMARLANPGQFTQSAQQIDSNITVKMDGGQF
jgi:hypothetical protein